MSIPTDPNSSAPPVLPSDGAVPEIAREWNRTFRAYPLNKTIACFLEEQASRSPSQTAVVGDGEPLTYRELNHQVNELALHLRGLGVVPDTLVGVLMERSIEMVVALLGVVKAGGAYVPLDPDYPHDRLQFMLQDAGITVLLTQEALRGILPDEGVRTICLDSPDWLQKRRTSLAANPPITVQPDNLVYMIYTSGSTGKPKGVANIHRGLVNRILWMQEVFQLGAEDRVLQKTPFSFDVSVWEFFWPLMTGASMVMAKPGGHKDSAYLIDTIARHHVTTMHFVPSMLSLFLSAEGLERAACLRRVMCSGEALPLELTKRFFARLPGVELHNLYGPTEASIDVTHWPCRVDSAHNLVPIGSPIANTQMYILAEDLRPVPLGEAGELHIGGVGLARGYWKRDELTRERFIADPFSPDKDARLYKTGDRARYLPDGAIEYLGRLDFQVKIRGFRIELGEIEAALLKHEAVQAAIVIATDSALAEKQLVAYLVSARQVIPPVTELRERLLAELPDYMVPARFIFLDKMPLLPNGKVDRQALPVEQELRRRPSLAMMYVEPKNALEETIHRIWRAILKIDVVGTQDNFFELGGNSLLALQVAAELRKAVGQDVPVVKVFQYPTVCKLAASLAGDQKGSCQDPDDADERATRLRIGRFVNSSETDGVAVVGMVGRFPGAASLEELWRNLCGGVESITRFSLDELGPGIDDETKSDPDYVPARGILADADKFDAQFFGIGPLEARLMDPQQRVFLELAWAALENAGHSPSSFPGLIGVYAGVGDNHYFTNNVLCHPNLIKTVGRMIVGYGNEKDYIATRVSYALNLTGPAVSANTGCSTSLLAVDLAFKALLDFECDMALAGGVDIFVPQRSGQLYQEGGTFTKDGHCRPFDASATGTMFCDGAGIVVLRRLQDALASGDRIYAVIRGSAKNNDGANKVSFLAPSVEGQARVILLAQAQANVDPATISYIEAHGTATPLGDPIEITALTKAFAAKTDKKQFCYIGSIKGNIGHPTIASGVAGLIKASLALHHERIPGTLHYREPNPRIDFANSPFKVVAETMDWPRGATPRRAGVSSFGFGGTNVHVVLEEAPPSEPSGPSRRGQLLLFSAKKPAALERLRASFTDYFNTVDSSLADVAYTLQVGRIHHAERQFVVCESAAEAAGHLGGEAGPRTGKRRTRRLDPEVVFMFPGQGAQHVNMGRSLYQDEPVFRNSVDRCCEILRGPLQRDLRDILYPPAAEHEAAATDSLNNTRYTQPALFVIEYSLAQIWISLGVKPSATVGHSIGEFVSACLGGVFTLEDALRLVALRGRLMSELPPGRMLSVGCAAQLMEARLPPDIQLAASNGPKLCVVAGPAEALDAFGEQLEREGVRTKMLRTSHAFHSKMMEPIVAPFEAAVRQTRLAKPTIPFVSTCTGDWITDDLATSPEYWGRHLRMPVRFSDAVTKLLRDDRTFLEVGPRDVLTTLARQHAAMEQRTRIVSSLGGDPESGSEWSRFLCAIGELWLNGNTIDWMEFHRSERRRRLPLPTYPFEREVHWVDPVTDNGTVSKAPRVEIEGAVAAESAGSLLPSSSSGQPRSVMRRLIAMLERVSGVPLSDDFDGSMGFAQLGLDSLFLTQLAFTIKEEFGVKLSMRQLLEDYSNLQLLEGHLLAKCPNIARPESETPSAASPPEATNAASVQQDLPQEVPTGGLQREILELSQGHAPGCSAAFNESLSVALKGANFNVSAMREALHDLVNRHQALRCALSADGKRLLITPSTPSASLSVPFTDLSVIPEPARTGRLVDVLKDAFVAPFDLNQQPIFRAEIVRMAADLHVVVLTSHLAVCDGWAMDVLVSDLGALYSRRTLPSRGQADLPTAGLYSEYVQERERFALGEEYGRIDGYWRGVFRDRPITVGLPARTDRPVEREYRGGRLDLDLDPRLVRDLKKLGAKVGCSLFTVLLAGFNLLLRRLSGNRRQMIGMPAAGQNTQGKTGLVGNCLVYVPIVSTVDDDAILEEYLLSLRATVLGAIDNSRYDFSVLKAEWPRSDDPGREPFMPVCVNMSPKMQAEKLGYGGLQSHYATNPRYFESFELFVNAVTGEGDTLVFQFQYNASLFEIGEVRRWQGILLGILAKMAEGSTERLACYATVQVQELSPTDQDAVILKVVSELCRFGGAHQEGEEPGAEPQLREHPDAAPPAKLCDARDTPLYFGPGHELFGICRIPTFRSLFAPSTGVLFCYPIGQEYIRSHWAFRVLSNFLLQSGLPVFKFDYYGTGDSLGDMSDMGAERWVEDVKAAAAEFKTAAGISTISLVALRYGAVTAAKAIGEGLSVEDLVLWDPVVSGATYLAQLKRVQRDILDGWTHLYPFPTEEDLDVGPEELVGFFFPNKLQQQIEESNLLAHNLADCGRVHIVVSQEEDDYRALNRGIARTRKGSSFQVISDDGAWDCAEVFEKALLPSKILEAIVKIVSTEDRG